MKKEIILKNVQFSFPNVFEPKADLNGRLKFSVEVIFEKNSEAFLSAEAAIEEIKKEADGIIKKMSANKKNNFYTPLKFGDDKKDVEKYPMYKGKYFISAHTTEDRPPLVVDGKKNIITTPSEFYGGCVGAARIQFFLYDGTTGAGISARLVAVQKTHEGEVFGGSTKSQILDGFEVIESDYEL
jgi:hypothetical protein